MENKMILGLVLLLAFSALLVGCSSGSTYTAPAAPSGPAPTGGGCGVASADVHSMPSFPTTNPV